MRPLVDVIIPMYDSAPTIGETIESLRRQTMPRWRATVVDDGSTDGGDRIVRALADADARIALVRQANRGLAGARNRGLDETARRPAGRVLFLDADDWLTPGGLEALLSVEGRSACGGFELTDADGRLIGRECPAPAGGVGLDTLLAYNPFAAHAVLTDRSLIGELRFDESLPVCEDYDFWLRLAERGGRWDATPAIVAQYRIRPSGLSKRSQLMARTFGRVLGAAYERVRASGEDVDVSEARLARARGALALHFASVEALRGAGREAALRALDAGGGSPPREADGLALAGVTAFQLGLGVSPEIDGEREQAWGAALWRWWETLGARLGLDADVIERAGDRFAVRTLHPRQIARGMLARHAPSGAVGVVGDPARAAWIMREALSRGQPVRLLAPGERTHPGETLLSAGGCGDDALASGHWDAVRHDLGRERGALLRRWRPAGAAA
ncbi:MAG: glycosyltransferase family 2 protein [Phycisphaerales bacterium JB059]